MTFPQVNCADSEACPEEASQAIETNLLHVDGG